jgi:single-strand selective monofunctional uracil DNA glycosylase
MRNPPTRSAGSRRRPSAATAAATVSRRVSAAARDLAREVAPLRFGPPVACVYNPLDYARRPHDLYVARYGASRKRVVFLGMNPGPFGMAQTGVPFGEVGHVRDWLGIEAPVGSPPHPHPKRPVEGFASRRSEVSGARLWGAVAAPGATDASSRTTTSRLLPLLPRGQRRNRTPDRLPPHEQDVARPIDTSAGSSTHSPSGGGIGARSGAPAGAGAADHGSAITQTRIRATAITDRSSRAGRAAQAGSPLSEAPPGCAWRPICALAFVSGWLASPAAGRTTLEAGRKAAARPAGAGPSARAT